MLDGEIRPDNLSSNNDDKSDISVLEDEEGR